MTKTTAVAPSARAAAGAVGTGALGLLLYHLTGNWLIAGSALLLGAVLIGLLEQRAGQRRAQQRAVFQDVLSTAYSGNWSVRVELSESGELAGLAASFNQFLDFSQTSDEFVDNLATELLEIPAEIASSMAELSSGVEDQEASVEETSSLLANINTSIRGINAEIGSLASANEETASSIMEMGSAIEQVATSANALTETVESSTASVHELNAQIRRVSESGSAVQ